MEVEYTESNLSTMSMDIKPQLEVMLAEKCLGEPLIKKSILVMVKQSQKSQDEMET